MKLTRLLYPIALAVMIAASLSGCGASAADGSRSENFSAETTAAGYAAGVSNDSYYDESAEAKGMEPASQNAEQAEKKIIRNAELTIQTESIDQTYDMLTAKLINLGGTIYSENSNSSDFNASTSMTVKLPPENLTAFLDYAEECGKVTNKSVSTDDITDRYIDSEVRLENLRRSLQTYYNLLEETYNREDFILIQGEIDRITADIESYEALLSNWDKDVASSKVDIYIRQLQDPNQIDIEDVTFSTLSFENMGKIMWNGVKKCTDVILTIIQWILIIIVTFMPLIVIAAAVIAVLLIRRAVLDKKHPERIEQRRKDRERKRQIKENIKTGQMNRTPGYYDYRMPPTDKPLFKDNDNKPE